MKKYFLFSILAISFFISASLFAQDTIINGTHYRFVKPKVEYNRNHKRLVPLDSEFVMDNKKFKYYNKWFTIGAGVQQNLTYKRDLGFAGGADFNFHIKRNYFQIGMDITGESTTVLTNYEFHIGYGVRYEDKDVHFSAFIGPSFSTGYAKEFDTIYIRPYNQFGMYAQVEAVKKIAYDVGIGFSLFADWNQEQSIIGFRGILYFSGSYRGKKHVVNAE